MDNNTENFNGIKYINSGFAEGWINGEHVFSMESVSISFIKSTGTLLKWGDSNAVAKAWTDYSMKLRAAIEATDDPETRGEFYKMTIDRVIYTFKVFTPELVEELNRCINNSGYSSKFIGKMELEITQSKWN